MNEFGAMALQRDGDVVLAGGLYSQNGSEEFFALARMHLNGRLNLAFGDRGVMVGASGYTNGFNDVALRRDGKILAIGSVQVKTFLGLKALLGRFLG